HVALEPQLAEGIQDVGVEAELIAEVAQVVLLEAEGLEELERGFESGGDEEPAVLRKIPNEQAEGRFIVHAASYEARGHVQLVEVGQQGFRRHGCYRLRDGRQGEVRTPCSSWRVRWPYGRSRSVRGARLGGARFAP